jgi:hypothetical protein
MKLLLKNIGNRFLFIFIILFIFSFPFPHNILPNLGSLFNQPFVVLSSLFGDEVLQLKHNYTTAFDSDSTGLYIHVLLLTVISSFLALISMFITISSNRLAIIKKSYFIVISYYLGSALLMYGFDKVFKHQFYLPEPNTLYTPLGNLSKDIAFWSVMGASRSYSVFSGLVEVIPALLLFFSKTRLLGAILTLLVMTNVVMINFGFDVSVKIYSLFLLLIALVIVLSKGKKLFHFFILGKSISQQVYKESKLSIKIVKGIVILLIIGDSLFPYIKSNNFNDDNSERPIHHGVYQVHSFKLNNEVQQGNDNWEKVFIHRKGYLIIQLASQKMIDYKMYLNSSEQIITLVDYNKKAFDFSYEEKNKRLTKIYGKVGGNEVLINLTDLNWKKMPLVMPQFNWTID